MALEYKRWLSSLQQSVKSEELLNYCIVMMQVQEELELLTSW